MKLNKEWQLTYPMPKNATRINGLPGTWNIKKIVAAGISRKIEKGNRQKKEIIKKPGGENPGVA